MSKRLFGAIVLISILILAMLTGCQSQANSGTPVSGASASNDGNTFFGQVTAVDGNNITVALIDNSGIGNGRQRQGNQGASSSTRPQRSPGSRPSGNWQQSQGNGGSAPSGGRGFGLNTTGESKTFTVTSSTTITNGGMRQYSQNSGSAPASASVSASPASISDIQKGSILSVKLSGDNAVSITIMQFGNRNGNGGNAQASDSPVPGGSDSASQTDAQPSPSASAALSSVTTPTPSIGAISSY